MITRHQPPRTFGAHRMGHFTDAFVTDIWSDEVIVDEYIPDDGLSYSECSRCGVTVEWHIGSEGRFCRDCKYKAFTAMFRGYGSALAVA